MRRRVVLIAGGGTGGHIFPGLSVAAALERLDPQVEVVWLGARHGLESRLVPEHGLRFYEVRARRVVGGSLWARLCGLATLLVGLLGAARVLRRLRPTVVLGVGGYASAAGGLMAALFRIPLVIQEQNALPGRTNRFLGRFARSVAVAFEEAEAHFPAGRAVRTGNPVRTDIAADGGLEAWRELLEEVPDDAAPVDERPLRVLVFGGSQGARFLNENAPALMGAFAQRGLAPCVLHQSGAAELESTRRRYQESGLNALVVPFIDSMSSAYRGADLVLCRSGATTVAELAVAQKPALLVPFPFAADDHQAKNAQALARVGAARMVRQHDWQAERLADEWAEIVRAGGLPEMARAAASLARPDADRRVAELVMRTMGARGEDIDEPESREPEGGR